MIDWKLLDNVWEARVLAPPPESSEFDSFPLDGPMSDDMGLPDKEDLFFST
jgi:hypothetical protein